MKKTSLKTTIAFFLLITPYVFLIISWVLEFLPVDDLVLFLGFLGATLLFPVISICFTIPSVILQIISLCKQQYKNGKETLYYYDANNNLKNKILLC